MRRVKKGKIRLKLKKKLNSRKLREERRTSVQKRKEENPAQKDLIDHKENEVSLRRGELFGGTRGCGMPLKTTPALQCKIKRYFALFTLFNNRALSVINSLIIAGDYRRLSHSTFCKASLLGYDLTIESVGEPTAETNKRLAANQKNSGDPLE